MRFLVTSASGANGDGHGALLAFDADGRPLGAFSDDPRIVDPRGLAIDEDAGLLFLNSGTDRILAFDATGRIVRDSGTVIGLNPGGGVLGADRRYYVGSRSQRTILAFAAGLDTAGARVVRPGAVPFPRGFGFGQDGRLFLASGTAPDGEGDNTIVALTADGRMLSSRFVRDPELSPLDLAVAPNGNIVVSSEYPFGAPDATTSIREYDARDGTLLRSLSPRPDVGFHRPRGLRFTRDGRLYCVARDEVVGFDFVSGAYLGAIVRFPRLHGQAVALF
jgi:hypothetical protein